MWFYLYLLTTSFHFQHGWTLVNTTMNIDEEHTILTQRVSFHDPWKYAVVYRIPFDRHLVSAVVAGRKKYTDETLLEWYQVDTRDVEERLAMIGYGEFMSMYTEI